jgi:hypothetical protein
MLDFVLPLDLSSGKMPAGKSALAKSFFINIKIIFFEIISPYSSRNFLDW